MDDPMFVSMLIGIGVICWSAGWGWSCHRLLRQACRATARRPHERHGKADQGAARQRNPACGPRHRPRRRVALGKLVPNPENLNLLYEQADVNLTFNSFMTMVIGLGVLGLVWSDSFFQLPFLCDAPGCGLSGHAALSSGCCRRKQKRIRKFVDAMPEAVELIGRALRAGHGLASGLHLVAEEMRGPIADEFGRVFEEQNLGIPIELSLRNMADRIPVMDVRFFVIAVIIQRATGGDLAEVLDKIGRLIRQRYELLGHVRALTAEGRLSGIVLLALPPGLLAFLSFSNYGYISPLFTTSVGTKMLVITGVLQLLGAWMINKIVAIKV